VIIIAPPGLLTQWREELQEKFALEFTVIENAAALARVQTDLPAGVSPWDALPHVLTSLDFIKKETVRNRALRKRWDLAIVDEAHALSESGTPQNPYRTQRTRLGLALRDDCRGLILLTATPHNGYVHSFRSLLELVDPTAAAFSGSHEAVVRRIERARIRRMKSQIHRRLPDGTEQAVFPKRHVQGIPVADLSPAERELLRRVASYCSQTARAAGQEEDTELIAFAMQIVKKRALSSRRALRETVDTRLKALSKEEAREAPPERSEVRDLQADLPLGEAAAERTERRILRSAIPKEERRRRNEVKALNGIKRTLNALPDRDPKVDALIAEIQRVLSDEPSEKLIVFTEYRDTLDQVYEALAAVPSLAGAVVILTGGLSSRQRVQRQQIFEKPETRILLATDAASEGLNLQRNCRRVVHFELPWNPNRLEQRNGRVDRYGQTRPPQIRYLYYPDSPEDHVLNTLVEKIERMAEARVSTPDILGILTGGGELQQGLVELDPEDTSVEDAKASLVRTFEDRTEEFIRNVQPLVAANEAHEMDRLIALLDTAEPLVLDDADLETAVTRALGAAAVSPGPYDGTFRLEVPLAFRGASIKPIYEAATFRRSVAVRHRADEVGFITPVHPLVQALAADVRRRFLHVYSSSRGIAPRRLAAHAAPPGEQPTILFTFLADVHGGGGLLEERLLAVRLDVSGGPVGDPEANLRLLAEERDAGEVQTRRLAEIFGDTFATLASRACEAAVALNAAHVRSVREGRAQQAAFLRKDLEVDLADRLREIREEESRARGLIEATGQQRLFGTDDPRGQSFETRRAAAEAQAAGRREEIAEFERVDEPSPPRPLGALFLVPADRAQ
jgi:superfamily II DNA or RNA helicase